MADNLFDDRKAQTNQGGRFRLQRITITRQPADFLLRRRDDSIVT
jgi:hypothetical protein